jgi:hypothetical protein
MGEAVKLITWAFENYPDALTILPPTIRNARREKTSRMKVDGSRVVAPATITIEVPDSLVKKLKHDPDFKDLIYVVHVRGELMDRYQSKIVLPGEN